MGWATGPAHLIDGVAAAHQFLTFSTPAPFQRAVAEALDGLAPTFYEELRREYRGRRDLLLETLAVCGFDVASPEGSYFAMCRLPSDFEGDDRDFARFMAEEVGVAVIPPSPFYSSAPEEGARLSRIAFCKREETLREAADRLERRFAS